ncbi:sugar ABC transporter ATP-binding protein [Candidatus Protofrankia californiensis]|uniref:sugar ABC transporter ATP-binding protein n=1 Tax=Candidatus Protofrankia californiensis TaxID=1839754 RepID=UPI001040E264|nr:sugar ABC transporter ATP-binding protein [Candidatus Protofrankia californiensis]
MSVRPEYASDRGPLALAMRGVSKTFFGHAALSSVDIDVAAGEIHALLGENGSGKSTIIKILSGYHRPDPGGEITVAGRTLDPGSPDSAYALGCRFVHQDLGLIDSRSIADNLALVAGFPLKWGTVREAELRRNARRDLSRIGLDLDPDLLVGELSPAERTGVAVARALREDESAPVSLLVLDEPTATLPDAEVQQLLSIVRTVAAGGVGVLYVTHRLDEVFQVAATITVLRDGHRVARVPVSSVDRAELISLLVGTEFEDIHRVSAELPTEHDQPLLVADAVSSGPIDRISLEVRAGDVVGLAGITGSGRESLLSVLFGAHPRQAGVVRVGEVQLPSLRPDLAMKAGLAFLPPNRKTQGGFFDLTVRENITVSDLEPFWRRLRLSRRRENAEVASWIDRLSVRPPSTEAPLSSLSGGNQQKVLFAKWLRRSPKVLLLDEPTQGVDIGAKAELHMEILQAARSGAGVVVSSSDTDELAALCHRVLVLREGRIAAHLAGSAVTAAAISRACLGADDGGIR